MTCATCGRPTKDFYADNRLIISWCTGCGKDDCLNCTCEPVDGFKPNKEFLNSQKAYVQTMNNVMR